MYKQVNILYKQSKNGDIESIQMLTESLKPLIIASIRRYYNKKNQYDDLIQEGYEIILKALKDFNPNKGVHFLGYVKMLLKYHYLNKLNRQKEFVSLNAPICSEDGNLEIIDNLPDTGLLPEELSVKNDDIRRIWTSILSLTERQRMVIIMYYIDDMKINQIASKLGVSYRTVVNTKTTALRKMRKSVSH